MRYYVALFAGALVLLPSQAAAQQQHTDFSGRWIYDSAKSDHVTPQPMSPYASQAPQNQAEPREGGEGGGEPGEGGEGGEGGAMGGRFGGGYGGGFGGRMGRRLPQKLSMEDRIRLRALMVLARPDTALDILETDSTVTLITDADTLVLYPNMKKTTQVLPGGAKAETRADWKDNGDLRVERDLGSGMKLVQRFTLSGTKSYLWLYVTANNGQGNMQIPFLRVYYRPGGRP